MSSLTLGEPLTTRETVARDTPATLATSSRVAPLVRPSRVEVVNASSMPSVRESALTLSEAQYHRLSRERSHKLRVQHRNVHGGLVRLRGPLVEPLGNPPTPMPLR